MPALLRGGAALLLLVAVAGCGADVKQPAAPLDRFDFPTALAYDAGHLLVVSSNFDLRYSPEAGGSVLAVDPAVEPAPVLGGVRVGSFGGEIGIADAARCGLPESLAFVASRERRELYRMHLRGGVPVCEADCAVPLRDGPLDPYGVTVTCPAGGPARAWVGYLRAPDGRGHATAIELVSGKRVTFDVGVGSPRSFAYDEQNDRLFFTASFGALGGLGWIELAGGCELGPAEVDGGCPVRFLDLSALESGVDVRGIAISNDAPGRPRRLYVAARIFDVALAAAIGGRPGNDVGGALLVLELTSLATGAPGVRLVRSLQVGLGASEVRVLPARAGQRDLVALTATRDGLLWIYDDELGAMVSMFGRDPATGAPVVGALPFAMAVEPRAGAARLYVGSFEHGYVTPVDVPLATPWEAALVRGTGAGTPIRRIGQENR